MEKLSTNNFTIYKGLQQGMVNSSTFFNLGLYDLVQKMDNIIAFADDLIICHTYDKIGKTNKNLHYFGNVEIYARDWQLKIN